MDNHISLRDGMMTISLSRVVTLQAAMWASAHRIRYLGCYGRGPEYARRESIMAATNEKQLDQGLIVASLASECRLPIGAMATMYQCPHIFAICTVLQSLRRQDIAELIVAARQPALSGL